MQTVSCQTFGRVALTLIVSLATGYVSAEAPWDLAYEEDNLQVFTRKLGNSPYLEVKGTVEIEAPIERVTNFLGDGNGCAAWRNMCDSSEVIREVSEQERYVYLVLDLPWPLSDRDLVLHSTTILDEETRSAIVKLKTASSEHPMGEHIRAESSGQFVLRTLGEERVEFTYIMHTDLGGNLPAGAVNDRLTESTRDDLTRLRQLAER